MKHLKQWALTALLVLATACSSNDEPTPTPVPPTPTPQSSAKALTMLQFTQVNNPSLTASYIALIDETAKTARLVFPNGTNIIALKPTFTVSDKATLKIGNDLQTSNTSVWNLLGPLTVTVVAENGTSQPYVITTVVSPPSDPVLADAIAYFGKAIYKSDFPVAKLKDLTYENVLNTNTTIESMAIGDLATNALVLLVFDKTTGLLYTPTRYNTQFNTTAMVSTDGIEELFTDLLTYKQVTGVIQATQEYSQRITTANTSLWIFDAYVSSFETNVSKEAAIVAKLASLPDGNNFTVEVPVWAKLANVVYYSWTSITGTFRVQQTGCIIQETKGIVPGTIYNNVVDQMYNTAWVRSVGSVGCDWGRMIPGGGVDLDRPDRTARASFALASLTYNQKSDIINFQFDQAHPTAKPYKLTLSTASRYNQAYYYAGKLQWLAYMLKGNVNIDRNGGSFVFGDDIILNPIFTGVKF
jgi:hypothetical protein